MVSLVLFALASLCNSVMDTLRFHFESSPFRNLNPYFWNPNVSYRVTRIIPFTGYKVDAWHLFKSAMIILIVFGMVFYRTILTWYFDVLIFGFVWNTVFTLSYKKMYETGD